MIPAAAWKEALRDFLKRDAAVVALVGGKVFDEVQRDPNGAIVATPPWVYIGPIGAERDDNSGHFDGQDFGGVMFRVTTRIFCAGTSFGRSEVWTIANAVAEALEGENIGLAPPLAQTLVCQVQRAGDVIDPLGVKQAFIDVTAEIAG